MDGSKRSSHGNAYFTGFGARRRIVFFDTLLDAPRARRGRGGARARARPLQAAGTCSSAWRGWPPLSLAFLALLAWLVDATVVLRGARRPGPATGAPRRRAGAVHARAAGVHVRCSRRCRRCIRAGTSSRPTPSPPRNASAAALGRGAGQALRGQRRHADARPAALGVLRFASAGRRAHRAARAAAGTARCRPAMPSRDCFSPLWSRVCRARGGRSPQRRSAAGAVRARATPNAGKALVERDCVRLPRAAVRRRSRPDLPARRPPGARRRRSCWRRCTVCNTELGAGYFPDEEEHIAAYLNLQYYKFKP